MEVALKTGYLFIPPQTFLRKTWMKRYCVLYSASQQGIQRLELFENDEAFVTKCPSKIIPLNDCWKVASFPKKQQPNVFEVRRKEECHLFSSDTFQEMTEWLTSLQSVAFGKNLDNSILTVCEKQEENFLYSTVAEPEIHKVKVLISEASTRNNLSGDYELIITPVNIALANEDGKVVLRWPYRHIRRYGCTPQNFSFEAGRKCSSGEGVFIFETEVAAHIFKTIDNFVSSFHSAQEDLFSKDISKWNKTVNENRSSLPTGSSTEHYSIKPPIKKPPRKTKSRANSDSSSGQDTEKKLSPCQPEGENPELLNAPSRYRNASRSEITRNNRTQYSEDMLIKRMDATVNADNGTKKVSSCYNVNYFEVDTIPKRNCDVASEPSFLQSNSLLETTLTRNRRQSAPFEMQSTSDSSAPRMDPFYSNLDFLQRSFKDKLLLTGIEPQHYVKNEVEYAHILKKN